MDRTRGEWFENFQIKVAASIVPPLESRSWEMRNLFIHKTAKHALDFPLLKVNSFVDIFRKLSSFHVSIRPYWSVRWCHATASLLCIQHFPATPPHSIYFQWLKSPPRMKWSTARFVSLNCFHINALSFEEQVA
jgi:hypothetical protein